MSLLFVAALFVCPVGSVVERTEGPALVVLGTTGVRVIARENITSRRPHGIREGDRIVSDAYGCHAVGPTRADVERITAQLRALGAAR